MLLRENAVFVIVDVQGNLAQAMDGRDFLIENNRKLIKGSQVLGVPVLVTEQNNLGTTRPELAELLPGIQAIPKDTFSCCGEERFMSALKALRRKQILLSGIEAHVCVYQTAMDLMRLGYEVHLVADAVSSRTAGNRELGVRKTTECGALLTGAEMALFELLNTATDPGAREIFRIVK